MESIIVNKRDYDFIQNPFDTVMNLLIKNNKLRAALASKNKLSIIIKKDNVKPIKENINAAVIENEDKNEKFQSSINNSNETNQTIKTLLNHENKNQDDNTENQEETTSIDLNTPLFGGAAIYQGKNNLLYGDAKVGKTYFSIEVAKSERIKKPLFILLEDYSSDQAKRYEANLAGKDYSLIKLKDFGAAYNKERKAREGQADLETLFDANMPNYHRLKVLKRENYREYGLIDKTGKLDRLAVMEKILDDAIKDGNDFICIDPLLALMENWQKANRSNIENLISKISKHHITLLLIHHTNAQGKMALKYDLKNAFDNIYKLEELARNNDGAELKLIEEGARDNAPHDLVIKRTFSGSNTVKYEVLSVEIAQPGARSAEKTNMQSMILAVVETYFKDHPGEILSYSELISALEERTGKKNDEANIEKRLHELEEEYVAKADGRTWKSGIKNHVSTGQSSDFAGGI